MTKVAVVVAALETVEVGVVVAAEEVIKREADSFDVSEQILNLVLVVVVSFFGFVVHRLNHFHLLLQQRLLRLHWLRRSKKGAFYSLPHQTALGMFEATCYSVSSSLSSHSSPSSNTSPFPQQLKMKTPWQKTILPFVSHTLLPFCNLS